MVTATELVAVVDVNFPAAFLHKRNRYSEVRARVSEAMLGRADCAVVAERAGFVTHARLRIDHLTVDVCFSRRFSQMGQTHQIHAPNASVRDGVLDLGGDCSWQTHPGLDAALDSNYLERVLDSWRGSPILHEFATAEGGESVQLRLPQLGALHALAAHWSVKASHAKIVLPTGTGKTDVMIAGVIMAKALRSLIIVPSDALRIQLSEKFESLGILKKAGAVDSYALSPVVGKLLKCPADITEISSLRAANIVVSTTQMLLGMGQEMLGDFLSWFDLVMFDEAHHLPASSWARISDLVAERSRIVSVTATPYRNDGKRVPGDLIYQFPLRLAQKLDYFAPISVARVDEINSEVADLAIARAAVAALRRDEVEDQWLHIILARARSKEHADALYELYRGEFPELDPVVLHSGIGINKRKAAIDGLRALRHRVVVCVDMLGEGFDLPALKIAAMHELHKSLPVTLQFVGRFTRTSAAVGRATVVVNMAEPMAETAVAELFSEDADWNDLVPDLSARAIRSEEDIQTFLREMREGVSPEDRKFDLALLTPKTNVTLYTAESFRPERVSKGLHKSSVIHQSWINEEKNLLVFVTQDRVFPTWSLSKDAASFEWNMTVIAYDPDLNLLYMNSSQGASRLSSLAKAVGGARSMLISGEGMFRVFNGLHRAVLYNVGLYRRGQVRFQMLAGMDIGEHVTSALQAGSAKSNLFAIGYDDGKKTNIGASFKGRIWSMSPISIPDWVVWSKRVATKVIDNQIATNSFLQFTLIPTEVTQRPNIDVFACIPPDELLPGDYHGQKKISVYGSPVSYSQVDLSLDYVASQGDEVLIKVSVGLNESIFRLTWAGGFRVSLSSGPRVRLLVAGAEADLDGYLTAHAPPLLLRDGSELVGGFHFRLPTTSPYTFSSASILPIDWGDTPITVESKWRSGQQRPSSIQGFLIDKFVSEENDFVIDDDDTGEAADIIVIKDDREARELEVTLYHCKYASGAEPGARYGDLYEVCGQAVKSCRLLHRPENLLAHIVKREGSLRGRPTRFEKGDIRELRSLQKRIDLYRTKLNICIAQPGLSAGELTSDLSAILAAADGFILDFTGRRLRVIGSA